MGALVVACPPMEASTPQSLQSPQPQNTPLDILLNPRQIFKSYPLLPPQTAQPGIIARTSTAAKWVCCTLYLGHLPNDFCVTSPTNLLHFPNNLLRFPNKIASFPQQLESLPQQLVSLPQHIFSFPQQLCVTLPPAKKSCFAFFNSTCFSYLNIPASF